MHTQAHICAVYCVHADPILIIPLYSSLFSDEARLVYCLVVHPIILEFCLQVCRRNSIADYDERAQAAGLGNDSIQDMDKRELFNCQTEAPLLVEVILVFVRRFLIG